MLIKERSIPKSSGGDPEMHVLDACWEPWWLTRSLYRDLKRGQGIKQSTGRVNRSESDKIDARVRGDAPETLSSTEEGSGNLKPVWERTLSTRAFLLFLPLCLKLAAV